jgi:protease-4
MNNSFKVFLAVVGFVVVGALALGLITRFSGDILDEDTIAVLRIEGPIINVDWYMEQVEYLRDSPQISAVVLRLDTPGGAVAPTQELYSELLKLKDEKPVVTSMGTIAASGGYYLSCATDYIISNPGTITGSVGVIMEFSNIEELFSKLGISSTTIKSGKFKDTGNPFRKMTLDEEELLQAMVMDVYDQFAEAVVEGRGLERREVEQYLDGRILSGRQALKAGLVDELGNYYDALDTAAEMAELPEVPENLYIPEQEREGIMSLLFGSTTARRLTGKVERYLDAGSPDRTLQLWRAF